MRELLKSNKPTLWCDPGRAGPGRGFDDFVLR